MLIDIVFMETVGMRPVVVHGGGAAISRAMEEAGLEARFIQGRRYTDDATLAIVERVLATETNERHRQTNRRVRRSGDESEFPHHQRAVRRDRSSLPGENGEPIDLGYVGRVTRVDRTVIDNLCYARSGPGHPLDVHGRSRGRNST